MTKAHEILDTKCICGKLIGDHDMKRIELCLGVIKLYELVKRCNLE